MLFKYHPILKDSYELAMQLRRIFNKKDNTHEYNETDEHVV